MDRQQSENFNSDNMNGPYRNYKMGQLHSEVSDRNLLPEFCPPFESASFVNNQPAVWDLNVVLNNLSVLEEKIHQVKDIIRSLMNNQDKLQRGPNGCLTQQQILTADLTSIVIQLISTAGTLLPQAKNTLLPNNSFVDRFTNTVTSNLGINSGIPFEHRMEFSSEKKMNAEFSELVNGHSGVEGTDPTQADDPELKDEDGSMDDENFPPGSYELLQLEKDEILAPHTHFCSICNKGFKRDANLRMHMRGHGDEYKTTAALAKPPKEASSDPVVVKRYSCPFVGCKRNKEHKNFQPLKTILCMKNHYKRSHCEKSYICSRCRSKKFSVLADLKTHEKHCGRDKWLCSCGTTFSRKDKLFGHVALFQGHTPVLPSEDSKGIPAGPDWGITTGSTSKTRDAKTACESFIDPDDYIDMKALENDQISYSPPINYDCFDFSSLDEYSRRPFDLADSSLAFIDYGSRSYTPKNGEN